MRVYSGSWLEETHSVMVEKAQWQEWEATGHTVSPVKKHRVRNQGVRLDYI